jgi:sRNA-binding regulator protein Hfq
MGEGRNGKATAQPSRTQQQIFAEVERLEGQGMPRNLAVAVARGKLGLNQALERMARSDRVDRLMREHQLNRGLATQVVLGQANLEEHLQKRRFEEYKSDHFQYSYLKEASEAEEDVVLGLCGGRREKGLVTAVDKFTVQFVDQKGVESTIKKIDIKYAYAAKQWKEVGRYVKTRGSDGPEKVEPSLKPQERFRCSDKRLFGIFDGQSPVEIKLLEGERLSGKLSWLSRYECGVELGSGSVITVFRHSMCGLRHQR